MDSKRIFLRGKVSAYTGDPKRTLNLMKYHIKQCVCIYAVYIYIYISFLHPDFFEEKNCSSLFSVKQTKNLHPYFSHTPKRHQRLSINCQQGLCHFKTTLYCAVVQGCSTMFIACQHIGVALDQFQSHL